MDARRGVVALWLATAVILAACTSTAPAAPSIVPVSTPSGDPAAVVTAFLTDLQSDNCPAAFPLFSQAAQQTRKGADAYCADPLRQSSFPVTFAVRSTTSTGATSADVSVDETDRGGLILAGDVIETVAENGAWRINGFRTSSGSVSLDWPRLAVGLDGEYERATGVQLTLDCPFASGVTLKGGETFACDGRNALHAAGTVSVNVTADGTDFSWTSTGLRVPPLTPPTRFAFTYTGGPGDSDATRVVIGGTNTVADDVLAERVYLDAHQPGWILDGVATSHDAAAGMTYDTVNYHFVDGSQGQTFFAMTAKSS